MNGFFLSFKRKLITIITSLGTTNTACLLTIKKVKEEVKKEGEEPMFTKGLVDKWIDRGGSLIFNCTVTGSPKPEIKW